jgi:hypothetical protein
MHAQRLAFLGTVIPMKPIKHVYVGKAIETQQRIAELIKNLDAWIIIAFSDNTDRFEVI